MSAEQRPDGWHNYVKTILFVYSYNIQAHLHLLLSKSVSLALFIEISSSQNPQKTTGSWWRNGCRVKIELMRCTLPSVMIKMKVKLKTLVQISGKSVFVFKGFFGNCNIGLFLTWPLAKEEFNEVLWCENGCSDVWTGVCEWRTQMILVYEAMGVCWCFWLVCEVEPWDTVMLLVCCIQPWGTRTDAFGVWIWAMGYTSAFSVCKVEPWGTRVLSKVLF